MTLHDRPRCPTCDIPMRGDIVSVEPDSAQEIGPGRWSFRRSNSEKASEFGMTRCTLCTRAPEESMERDPANPVPTLVRMRAQYGPERASLALHNTLRRLGLIRNIADTSADPYDANRWCAEGADLSQESVECRDCRGAGAAPYPNDPAVLYRCLTCSGRGWVARDPKPLPIDDHFVNVNNPLPSSAERWLEYHLRDGLIGHTRREVDETIAEVTGTNWHRAAVGTAAAWLLETNGCAMVWEEHWGWRVADDIAVTGAEDL